MSGPEDAILDGARPPAETLSLFGHDAALDFLGRAYQSGKSHHAILIEGPEGIGKATLAFRFANHVLAHPDAQSAPDVIAPPDPDSTHFRQVASGASHNLIHLTRPFDEKAGRFKSAITVDEVRRVGRFFGQTSGSDNWRIVIVDTADDLNRNAANAILKMLEEPPKRAMFLVLSHAPGKLLPTIRSRCLPLPLRPLSDPDLEKALKALGFEVSPESRSALFAQAGGSVSEALKLVNYGGLEILNAFESVLSQAPGGQQRQDLIKLAEALSAKGSDTIFAFFADNFIRRIEADARAAALNGDLPAGARMSELSSALKERIDTSVAYNLDRKQIVMNAVESYLFG
ncbi:DNA polymerase-3 subunit delta' [Rhizobium aquaticum]|uniref:DNA polymerase-3 subunit delta n=1 Tax=Rhizobium aquaticum TaxID=1549636 RepID=A0ABV2IVY8_9HYPH